MSVKVTFVGKVGVRFVRVVTWNVFLSKGLQYVLCLCRLMYTVVQEFILMILSDISKCTNQCDFLGWALYERCVFYLVWHLFDKRIEMHQSWRKNCNCMFPKRAYEFVVFMSILLLSVKVTFVGKVEIIFMIQTMCVVTWMVLLGKPLQYVLCWRRSLGFSKTRDLWSSKATSTFTF